MREFGELLAFEGNKAQSLFRSEGYFWLTTALAVSFAAETLEDGHETQENEPLQSQRVLTLFNRCIRNDEISAEELAAVKETALANVAVIDRYNGGLLCFEAHKALRLCRCFTTYWLFFKLIELEWQEVLEAESLSETYQFMDIILAESEELAAMQSALDQGQALDCDQKVYLRNHWRQVQRFWRDLRQDLTLLDAGFLVYQPLFC